MFEIKDYSNLSLNELLAEEKKLKKGASLSAGLIGFLIGVLVYGIVTKGFGFYNFLPLFLIAVFYKNSLVQKQNLQLVQAEIKNKGA